MTWRATADYEESMEQIRQIIRRDVNPLLREFEFFLFKIERKRHPWRRRPIKKWGRS
jgi:hypothetical protein